ncbi:lytic murein transglycosylase [Halomonas nitroreducens]|uniref:Lytic murein transglycosylase n=1 Tax=Halomonas nitroreducens TaxID=447425 RepID=A0A3S0HTG6_9GAMM|nr:lytic murein transglycosylase [Halomonas nitroreducens]RTR03817.1 lytic murein transglycosylase [Halomonas nitroreducens]
MMPRIVSLALLCAALAGCQARAAAPEPVAASGVPAAERAQTAGFDAWRASFRARARAAGIAEATLARTLDGLRYRPRVIELDRSQPEFVRPLWAYLDSAVSAPRIRNGRARLAEHRAAARTAARRYGVPAEILVAIWGIESSYGGYLGDFSTLEALATLAYEGRRRDFARDELIAALRIIEAGDIAPARMVGSWAGAMGHTQFLPSSYLAYAVDGDGDGRRDIWGSIPDVLASTAHYLDAAGWREGEAWGVEVVLPADFDYGLTDPAIRRPSAEWAAAGIRSRQGRPLPALAAAAVIAPAGARGPAFLVGHNFRVIRRYNNATSYALAVASLSDVLAGRPAIEGAWPREEPSLKRAQVSEMQRRLNALGHDVGAPDGILGPNTRRGLRAFQRWLGLVPDGFATLGLLERLRHQTP